MKATSVQNGNIPHTLATSLLSGGGGEYETTREVALSFFVADYVPRNDQVVNVSRSGVRSSGVACAR